MRDISIQEFSVLCKDEESELFRQILAIPGTISPEKLFDVAERNGYRIRPERGAAPDQVEELSEEMLDRVSGGASDMTREEQLQVFHTWLHRWMGFDRAEGDSLC